jgi:16S rRNA (guanine966-N2)-methyltransferase
MSKTGEVRIIGGNLKRSKLKVPDRPGLRPTPDRVRETLFNWLQWRLPGMRALDLYAGTGVLGLEALSRGAAFVHFNERDGELARAIDAELQRFQLRAQAGLSQLPALALLAQPCPLPFDLVFLDPPYASDEWLPALHALTIGGWLRPQALVYFEHPRGSSLELPPGYALSREAQAGQVRYGLCQYIGADSEQTAAPAAE